MRLEEWGEGGPKEGMKSRLYREDVSPQSVVPLQILLRADSTGSIQIAESEEDST